MDKTSSRLTYSLFFLLFFIMTPLLTLYALGYRYDFKTGHVEKDGALYVKSYPRGAEIYVDGKKISKKTPTQIINVRAAIHSVQVQKNNYVTWFKKLEVKPGDTTFAEDIVLFLENRPKTNLGPGSDKYLANELKNKYAYLTKDYHLMITDVEEAKNFDIFTLDKDYDFVDWSNDDQKLLLKNNNTYYIFDINQKALNKLTLDAVDKIVWGDDSQTLFYLKNEQLFKYSLVIPEQPIGKKIELTRAINDFAFYKDYLLILYSIKQNNFVEQLNKNDLKNIQTITNVNLGELTLLTANRDQAIFTVGSQLYIKNKEKEVINLPITLARIHDQRLLISSGHEIILYNYQTDWQDLIDRSSQIIVDVVWHPNGSYFINEVNNKTYLTEIDGRYKRNTIKLLDDPLTKTYIFNKKGDRLFVLTPQENFYLTIQ